MRRHLKSGLIGSFADHLPSVAGQKGLSRETLENVRLVGVTFSSKRSEFRRDGVRDQHRAGLPALAEERYSIALEVRKTKLASFTDTGSRGVKEPGENSIPARRSRPDNTMNASGLQDFLVEIVLRPGASNGQSNVEQAVAGPVGVAEQTL
jgi:hypothetical protein